MTQCRTAIFSYKPLNTSVLRRCFSSALVPLRSHLSVSGFGWKFWRSGIKRQLSFGRWPCWKSMYGSEIPFLYLLWFCTAAVRSLVSRIPKHGLRPSSHFSFTRLCADCDKSVCKSLHRRKIRETRLESYRFVDPDTTKLTWWSQNQLEM